ncbi:cobalt/nickel transport system permease protein [Desulfonatronum thiosulfatophilum]|uniref:Cobalt/nickel transport system permease protein n=1 Tax=Desulfonatronum thiosulfatophilum TaxID=617002 RepID=A0A1G6D5Q0_9BACT|nr:cobalt transporter CbiM [Desulfonatronum thiosulfatophilum]SDB40504.1 cobalt/nickel transport system permease protein [Desulfonatronum thiosulfatophilum]
MHIAEGILSAPVLALGAATTVTGLWIGLRRLDEQRLIMAAALAAVFFIGSLIHVPLGPGSVHLLLNGLAGLLLGWAAFPVIFTGLLLQALLFQFGGLLVLGVNTCTVALPAILCGVVLRGFLARGGTAALTAGFAAGSCAVLGTALLAGTALTLTDQGYLTAAKLVVLAHLPVAIIEGVMAMFVVGLLGRTRPDLLTHPTQYTGGTPC